jgi:hypothetical protein
MNTKHTYSQDELRRIAQMIEAFKAAKRRIASLRGTLRSPYICWALADVCEQFPGWLDAKELVVRALGAGCFALQDWQQLQGVHVDNAAMYLTDRAFAQRLLWLDKLIADCQAALDAQGYKP